MFSCSLAIIHHALVHCKLSVPYPRPACTTAMPCSSVSCGEYNTLNLGQVCIASNIVDAAPTTPQRQATNPNPNPDDINPQSNPKRNAWYLGMVPKCSRSGDLNLAYYQIRSQSSISVFHASGNNRDICKGPSLAS